jgi:hypothetical protein
MKGIFKKKLRYSLRLKSAQTVLYTQHKPGITSLLSSSSIRTCTIGSGPFSEDDLDSLPLLYKFHRQLTLLSQLEGTVLLFNV